ncbi:hypothetical protein BC938DRAFT_475675 [Jimgerdemannia flammicorona]|uniref:Uncharacterized protein n=1 Tax=Jimgerdemannia flammicorona TaxID=994334 RepID=A0A433PQ94_9FUNG|nr:hypothetical protein BC938DRAFT_475675 [Jimgerdemannia flammicorona]
MVHKGSSLDPSIILNDSVKLVARDAVAIIEDCGPEDVIWMPMLALPMLALPMLALPMLALPMLALPMLALPVLALPVLVFLRLVWCFLDAWLAAFEGCLDRPI